MRLGRKTRISGPGWPSTGKSSRHTTRPRPERPQPGRTLTPRRSGKRKTPPAGVAGTRGTRACRPAGRRIMPCATRRTGKARAGERTKRRSRGYAERRGGPTCWAWVADCWETKSAYEGVSDSLENKYGVKFFKMTIQRALDAMAAGLEPEVRNMRDSLKDVAHI